MNNVDFTAWVEAARELRRASDASERAFMEHLRAGEQQEGMWRPLAATFDRVLRDYDICQPSRYRNWCAATRVVPPKVIDEIGMHGATEAARIQDAEKRKAAIHEMRKTAAKSHVPLSKQNAEKIRSRYEPPASKVLGEESRVARLTKENRQLRKRIRDLEKENPELRKKLGERQAA